MGERERDRKRKKENPKKQQLNDLKLRVFSLNKKNTTTTLLPACGLYVFVWVWFRRQLCRSVSHQIYDIYNERFCMFIWLYVVKLKLQFEFFFGCSKKKQQLFIYCYAYVWIFIFPMIISFFFFFLVANIIDGYSWLWLLGLVQLHMIIVVVVSKKWNEMKLEQNCYQLNYCTHTHICSINPK